jgi:DNA-binding LacI/PurR family transcriptional regulator
VSGKEGRRPTIHDVAERAGVSKSLVSLVMRNAPQVSPARRRAVLDAARVLGYRPNSVARSLVEGSTHTIGVIVSDLRNPWYVDILDAFRRVLYSDGLRVLIGGGELDQRLDHTVVEAFLDLRVEALCVVGTLPYDKVLADAMTAIPAVVASSHSYELPNVDSVVDDDVHGMRLAVQHLSSLGHQRIAHIGGGSGGVAQERWKGYEEAMREHGLQAHIRIERCQLDEQTGYAAAHRLLDADERPTAIVAVNDMACLGAVSAAADLGVDVPGELSVVGYDNTTLASTSHLSLTSVDPRNPEIGELAARRLLARLRPEDGDGNAPGFRDRISPRLVVRRSTERPRNRSGDDRSVPCPEHSKSVHSRR